MTREPHKKEGLGKYWLISVGLHLGVLLTALIGMAIPHTMPDVAPPPIYVELAPVAEKAMAPTEGKQIQSQVKKEPEPKPIEEKKEKPKTALDQVLDTVKEEKKAEKEPEKEKKTAEKAKESPDAKKKKPDEKKKTEEAKKEKEQTQQSFDSLLKNLAEETPDEKAGDVDIKASENTTEPSGLPDFAKELTISEFDALRQQLARCWNIPAGARDADNLVIEVKVEVNNQRIATSAEVVDRLRYSTDTFFRAAADSAVRAVRAPECTPLELPPEKYDSWKSMIVVFDPREMF